MWQGVVSRLSCHSFLFVFGYLRTLSLSTTDQCSKVWINAIQNRENGLGLCRHGQANGCDSGVTDKSESRKARHADEYLLARKIPLPILESSTSKRELPTLFVATKHILCTMKFVVLASLLASAAAFAPQQAAKSTTALGAFEGDFGALPPLGFWDPLGLVADGNQEKFDRLRGVEIKHGRIAMLAVVGYLVQEAGFRLPGNIDLSGTAFADIPNGYAALEAIPYAGKLQLFAFIGALEVFVMRDFVGGEFVGDLRNNYFDLGWDTFSEQAKLRKRTIELNQGRAAMMGILGLMVHEQLGVSIIPSVAQSEYAF